MANPILQHIGSDGEFLHPIESYLQKPQLKLSAQAIAEHHGQTNQWRTEYVDWEYLSEVESHAFSNVADAIWDKIEARQEIVVTRWYEQEITMIIGLILPSILVLLMALVFS